MKLLTEDARVACAAVSRSVSLSLLTSNDARLVALQPWNIQATCKGYDQTVRMRRLI